MFKKRFPILLLLIILSLSPFARLSGIARADKPYTGAKSAAYSCNNAEFSQAIGYYKKALSKNDPMAYLNLAVIFKDLERYEQGIGVLKKGLSKFPADMRMRSLLARLYYLSNRLDQSIAMLNRIIRIAPDDLEALIILGLCYAAKKDDVQAERLYKKALLLDKNNVIARISLADLYSRLEKLPEAAEEYRKISIIDSSILRIYRAWAEVLFTIGKYKEAFRVYEKLYSQEPRDKSIEGRLDLIREKLGAEFFAQEKAKRVAAKARKKVMVKPALGAKDMVYVKVGLVHTDGPVEFKCSGGFEIISGAGQVILGNGEDGRIYGITRNSEDKIVISTQGKDDLIADRRVFIRVLSLEATLTLFNVKYGRDNFWANQADRSYRGQIEVNVIPAGLSVINKVSLEEYLYSVVPSEMPASWPKEALKAQAIAARSEALTKLGRHKNEGFDFCPEVHCQVYAGVENESPNTNQVVDETRGLFLTYKGKPVDAIYSSCCGGNTQDNIFSSKEDFPYLCGVMDSVAEQGLDFPFSPYELDTWLKKPPKGLLCDIPEYAANVNFRWVRIYTPEDIQRMLAEVAPGLGKARNIIVVKRNKFGHIDILKITGSKSSYLLKRESNIRKTLGGLRSTVFKVEAEYGKDRKPQKFVIYGAGWGHAVGMCQAGCRGMANQGRGYRDILKHYFTGVNLEKKY
ncbi:MAG: SpoIID/LytB domain-containing protein [Candidatus Omnitrophica bacterium]|nr:SpoIID/LytB domain-containing protein [Candidatus Omnitrophota bacterium]